MSPERQIPTNILIGEKSYSFGKIHDIFSATADGKKLKAGVRFGKYKPESISNRDWKKALGADVNNADHLQLSLGLTRLFLDYCQNPRDGWAKPLTETAKFSMEEQQLLQLTMVMHDWGESRSGDINFHDKTEEHEITEMKHLSNIYHEIFGTKGKIGKKEKEVLDKVTTIASENKSKLGQARDAIEFVGYNRTGLRAYSNHTKYEGELGKTLEVMGLEVSPNQIPVLLCYAEVYPPIFSYLKNNKDAISFIIDQAIAREGKIDPKVELGFVSELWFNEFLPATFPPPKPVRRNSFRRSN